MYTLLVNSELFQHVCVYVCMCVCVRERERERERERANWRLSIFQSCEFLCYTRDVIKAFRNKALLQHTKETPELLTSGVRNVIGNHKVSNNFDIKFGRKWNKGYNECRKNKTKWKFVKHFSSGDREEYARNTIFPYWYLRSTSSSRINKALWIRSKNYYWKKWIKMIGKCD